MPCCQLTFKKVFYCSEMTWKWLASLYPGCQRVFFFVAKLRLWAAKPRSRSWREIQGSRSRLRRSQSQFRYEKNPLAPRVALLQNDLKNFFEMCKAGSHAIGIYKMTRKTFFLQSVSFFFSQGELSFLRNQLEENKHQQQELTDSIEEKVRC